MYQLPFKNSHPSLSFHIYIYMSGADFLTFVGLKPSCGPGLHMWEGWIITRATK